MTKSPCTIAMIGLGVMGSNLARNLARHGQRVALYDRNSEAARTLAARHPEAGFTACDSIDALVGAVMRPRPIILLVPAGDPVDESLAALGESMRP